MIFYDPDEVRQNTELVQASFPAARVYFALKSLPLVHAAQVAHRSGARIDVCTLGELELVRRAGIPGCDVLFHGNNKSTDEIEAAALYGVEYFVCDGVEELEDIGSIYRRVGTQAKVILRAKVEIRSQTHKNIATAHLDQKFGLADDARTTGLRAAVKLCEDDPHINLVGLHSHLGSQILDSDNFIDGARALMKLFGKVSAWAGRPLDVLDLGGGFGVPYVESDAHLDIGELGRNVHQCVDEISHLLGIEPPEVFIEPGRFISASSCITVYEIGRVKRLNGCPTYVAVDGGMSDNIRAALYEAKYRALVLDNSDPAVELCRVVGKHCDAGDIVVSEVLLPESTKRGDLLAVPNTGAYCRSLANNYNLLPKPPVVMVTREAETALQRRETIEDLFALDVIEGL